MPHLLHQQPQKQLPSAPQPNDQQQRLEDQLDQRQQNDLLDQQQLVDHQQYSNPLSVKPLSEKLVFRLPKFYLSNAISFD